MSMLHHELPFRDADGIDAAARRRPRRNWTREAKGRVVAAMLAPGANVSEIARRHEISRQHLYLWRRAALAGELPLPPRCQDRLRTPVIVGRSDDRGFDDASQKTVEIRVADVIVRAPPGVDLALLDEILEVLKFKRPGGPPAPRKSR